MALTIDQQLQILKGDIKPPGNLLIDVVNQIALNHAVFVYDNPKDTSGNDDATSYQDKVYSLADQILKGNKDRIRNIYRIIISIIGDTFTFAQVQNANDNDWETQLNTIIIRSFEFLAEIKNIERTEYNSI